jgi:hypothetical protein
MTSLAASMYIQQFIRTLRLKLSHFNGLKSNSKSERVEVIIDMYDFVLKNYKDILYFSERENIDVLGFMEVLSQKLKEFRYENNILMDPKYNILL